MFKIIINESFLLEQLVPTCSCKTALNKSHRNTLYSYIILCICTFIAIGYKGNSVPRTQEDGKKPGEIGVMKKVRFFFKS